MQTDAPSDSSLFSSLRLSPSIIQVVAELGFTKMTPIQAQSIPLLLQGKDLIGQSKTGSGKTAAFTLPILEGLEFDEKRQLQTLVMCPTRELCTQVAREMRKLGRKHPGLQVLTLSGGEPLFIQLKALEKGAHIAVGTPGRILDHLSRGTLDFRKVRTVVLDEADRMLDMGFQDDMEKILSQTPKTRQTVLFSATFPNTIEAMSRAYQRRPIRVTIDQKEQNVPQIRQVYYITEPEDKHKSLLWLLQQNKSESAIIFCNLKVTVTELARELTRAGISAAGLHGDLEQNERDRVMAKFRNRSTRLLIATDVAARGLDVENLDAVYNFDLPATPEVYVHRIGRTGRAGKKGLAVTLVTKRQKSKILPLEQYVGAPLQEKTIAALEHLELRSLSEGVSQSAAMETLYISGGRKDKMRPGDILGALTGEAGSLRADDVGKIEIHDRFSYVAVSRSIAHTAMQRLSVGKIKGRKFRVHLVR